jgi:rfaE bifunctional protein nucleotidyltransferase chain/domain
MRSGPLVVLGDTLLDVDLEGSADRLAPDAPVPVVDCEVERQRPGGAGLAAVLASGLGDGRPGPGVVLVTALGRDRAGGRLRQLLGCHAEVLELPLRGATACKTRVRASGQSLVRLDTGNGRAASAPVGGRVEQALRGAGAVLVADYGRGVTAHSGLRAILGSLRGRVPVIWDPHPKGQAPVPGCRLVTPNQAEAARFAEALGPDQARPGTTGSGAHHPGARQAAGTGSGLPVSRAARDALALHRAWGAAVAVTLGPAGALLSAGEDIPFVAPVPAAGPSVPHDACGAGDCFAAAAAQVLRAGGLLTEAVTEAVRCASEFVSRGGAAAVPALAVPPGAGLAALLGTSRLRRATPPGLPGAATSVWDIVASARERGGRIVATGGCFDLLHAGHVTLLDQARRLGDCLVVCLNSDSSVRTLKGPGRPLVGAADRARILTALSCVDAVVVFEETTPSAVLERLRPDVWVKGGDYAGEDLAEAAVVRRCGGEVVLLPYAPCHSTSRLVAAARKLGEPASSGGKESRMSSAASPAASNP